jgi:hypothetical protein
MKSFLFSLNTTPVSGHEFIEKGTYTNCTVEVLKCEHCGHYSISWYKKDNPPMTIHACSEE